MLKEGLHFFVDQGFHDRLVLPGEDRGRQSMQCTLSTDRLLLLRTSGPILHQGRQDGTFVKGKQRQGFQSAQYEIQPSHGRLLYNSGLGKENISPEMQPLGKQSAFDMQSQHHHALLHGGMTVDLHKGADIFGFCIVPPSHSAMFMQILAYFTGTPCPHGMLNVLCALLFKVCPHEGGIAAHNQIKQLVLQLHLSPRCKLFIFQRV
mmetsp:Transcript_18074/g.44954  ORF Transcript_18074/g.44954 Transcript_18074/m.44954 type:complete len:206 (+) Transcript_18074:4113-4730(+)